MMVFILSDYQEDGADNVIVVRSRESLEFAMDENEAWIDANEWKTRAKIALKKLLTAHTDDDLASGSGKHNLHRGWGGMQLHVRRVVD